MRRQASVAVVIHRSYSRFRLGTFKTQPHRKKMKIKLMLKSVVVGVSAMVALSGALAAEALHWSFAPIRKPAVPAVKNAAWLRDGADVFIGIGGHDNFGEDLADRRCGSAVECTVYRDNSAESRD